MIDIRSIMVWTKEKNVKLLRAVAAGDEEMSEAEKLVEEWVEL